METYNVSDNRNGESHLIQGTESYPSLTTPFNEQFNTMYNERASEFIDQGLYYPTATNYGYYCTGFESPGEWEDHNKIFGIDGPDFQYAGPQTESLSYVYYTPSYGYAQSPYNPYNPYIPGTMIGVDGLFIGGQHYYAIPPLQDLGSSPTYVPVVIPPDFMSNGFPVPLLNIGTSVANRPDGRGINQNTYPPKPALNHKSSSTKILEGPKAKANTGLSNPVVINGSVPSGSTACSSHVLQGRTPGSVQQLDNISHGKVLSHQNRVKVSLPDCNGLSEVRSSAHGRSAVDKLHAKGGIGRAPNNASGNADIFALGEQNRGPRTNKSKDQLAVKAYTTKAGIIDTQGNVIIHTDQYNKEDFQIDYVDAKFFVIKSYSEDDVHKSIKYGVWSSTSHGNKKLQSAYEDAQKLAVIKSRGCPIFLFFSINASSQFCGVAEMIGPVDFYKDMDFWQQDKWSGSFPVKWDIIKDVPNTCFRHIILENNENKPVTNSRDTQEIMFKEGLEMLKIFKNHPLDTALFDNFLYYEKRQKFIQDKKTRLFKSFQGPFFVPALELADKLNHGVQLPSKEDKKITKNSDPNSLEETLTSATNKIFSYSDVTNSSTENENAKHFEVKDDITPTLSTDSLTLSLKPAESKPSAEAIPVSKSESRDVFTVGSMPIKVNRFSESSCILTVGTTPLDPKALQLDKGDAFLKTSTRN